MIRDTVFSSENPIRECNPEKHLVRRSKEMIQKFEYN